MIEISYSINGGGLSKKEFPNTTRGNQASVKFLESLKKEQLNHPWFYRLKVIESLQERLSGWTLRRNTKARYQAEAQLQIELRYRSAYLDFNHVSSKPEQLKVSIAHT